MSTTYGRDIDVLLSPIESDPKSIDWESEHCVLVVAKHDPDNDTLRLIALWEISGRNVAVSDHFGQWHTMDDNGMPSHIDRQLGATHYGVISCEDDYMANRLTNDLNEVNSTLFNQGRGITPGQAG